MPSLTLSIPCDPYLMQWFIHDSGGQHPVKLRKNSPESHLLRIMLSSKINADNHKSGGDLKIVIPSFKGMPPEYFNHISPRAQKAFIDILRKRFDLQLFSDLSPIIHAADRRDELIYAWMEANGIDCTETNWLAVDKRLRRMFDRLRTKIRVREYRSRKKNI